MVSTNQTLYSFSSVLLGIIKVQLLSLELLCFLLIWLPSILLSIFLGHGDILDLIALCITVPILRTPTVLLRYFSLDVGVPAAPIPQIIHTFTKRVHIVNFFTQVLSAVSFIFLLSYLGIGSTSLNVWSSCNADSVSTSSPFWIRLAFIMHAWIQYPFKVLFSFLSYNVFKEQSINYSECKEVSWLKASLPVNLLDVSDICMTSSSMNPIHCWNLPMFFVHASVIVVSCLSFFRWYTGNAFCTLAQADSWLEISSSSDTESTKQLANVASSWSAIAPGTGRLLRQVRKMLNNALFDAAHASIVVAPALLISWEISIGFTRILFSLSPFLFTMVMLLQRSIFTVWIDVMRTLTSPILSLFSSVLTTIGLKSLVSSLLTLAFAMGDLILTISNVFIVVPFTTMFGTGYTLWDTLSHLVAFPSLANAPTLTTIDFLSLMFIHWIPGLITSWIIALPLAFATSIIISIMTAGESALVSTLAIRRLSRVEDALTLAIPHTEPSSTKTPTELAQDLLKLRLSAAVLCAGPSDSLAATALALEAEPMELEEKHAKGSIAGVKYLPPPWTLIRMFDAEIQRVLYHEKIIANQHVSLSLDEKQKGNTILLSKQFSVVYKFMTKSFSTLCNRKNTLQQTSSSSIFLTKNTSKVGLGRPDVSSILSNTADVQDEIPSTINPLSELAKCLLHKNICRDINTVECPNMHIPTEKLSLPTNHDELLLLLEKTIKEFALRLKRDYLSSSAPLTGPNPISGAQPLLSTAPLIDTALLKAWQRRLMRTESALYRGDAHISGGTYPSSGVEGLRALDQKYETDIQSVKYITNILRKVLVPHGISLPEYTDICLETTLATIPALAFNAADTILRPHTNVPPSSLRMTQFSLDSLAASLLSPTHTSNKYYSSLTKNEHLYPKSYNVDSLFLQRSQDMTSAEKSLAVSTFLKKMQKLGNEQDSYSIAGAATALFEGSSVEFGSSNNNSVLDKIIAILQVLRGDETEKLLDELSMAHLLPGLTSTTSSSSTSTTSTVRIKLIQPPGISSKGTVSTGTITPLNILLAFARSLRVSLQTLGLVRDSVHTLSYFYGTNKNAVVSKGNVLTHFTSPLARKGRNTSTIAQTVSNVTEEQTVSGSYKINADVILLSSSSPIVGTSALLTKHELLLLCGNSLESCMAAKMLFQTATAVIDGSSIALSTAAQAANQPTVADNVSIAHQTFKARDIAVSETVIKSITKPDGKEMNKNIAVHTSTQKSFISLYSLDSIVGHCIYFFFLSPIRIFSQIVSHTLNLPLFFASIKNSEYDPVTEMRAWIRTTMHTRTMLLTDTIMSALSSSSKHHSLHTSSSNKLGTEEKTSQSIGLHTISKKLLASSQTLWSFAGITSAEDINEEKAAINVLVDTLRLSTKQLSSSRTFMSPSSTQATTSIPTTRSRAGSIGKSELTTSTTTKHTPTISTQSNFTNSILHVWILPRRATFAANVAIFCVALPFFLALLLARTRFIPGTYSFDAYLAQLPNFFVFVLPLLFGLVVYSFLAASSIIPLHVSFWESDDKMCIFSVANAAVAAALHQRASTFINVAAEMAAETKDPMGTAKAIANGAMKLLPCVLSVNEEDFHLPLVQKAILVLRQTCRTLIHFPLVFFLLVGGSIAVAILSTLRALFIAILQAIHPSILLSGAKYVLALFYWFYYIVNSIFRAVKLAILHELPCKVRKDQHEHHNVVHNNNHTSETPHHFSSILLSLFVRSPASQTAALLGNVRSVVAAIEILTDACVCILVGVPDETITGNSLKNFNESILQTEHVRGRGTEAHIQLPHPSSYLLMAVTCITTCLAALASYLASPRYMCALIPDSESFAPATAWGDESVLSLAASLMSLNTKKEGLTNEDTKTMSTQVQEELTKFIADMQVSSVLLHDVGSSTFESNTIGDIGVTAPLHIRPAAASLLLALVLSLRRIYNASPRMFTDAILPRLPSLASRKLAAAVVGV